MQTVLRNAFFSKHRQRAFLSAARRQRVSLEKATCRNTMEELPKRFLPYLEYFTLLEVKETKLIFKCKRSVCHGKVYSAPKSTASNLKLHMEVKNFCLVVYEVDCHIIWPIYKHRQANSNPAKQKPGRSSLFTCT